MANVYFELTAAARADRRAIVIALAEEIDDQQQQDRRRVKRYEAAAAPFLDHCRSRSLAELPIDEAHLRLVEAAERLLPHHPLERDDADAQ